MEAGDIVAFATTLPAVACVVAFVGHDGRSHKKPRMNVYSIRNNVWEGVEACPGVGWYKRNLRVSRCTFDQIVYRLQVFAHDQGHRLPAMNAFVDMRIRVAMTHSYLSQEGGFAVTAALFGVANATTIINVNEVMDLIIALSSSAIRLPQVNNNG
ncbi:hypothetical protein H257_16324 [Aphanomyces astaci]|uniref:Uncharacterized protein n=1 Tax=Aphanomyces astaci TaxID=112090 RepID=W4FL50_APHAT|nr:hypothetical protein H257_16324 [Aphanomyces astaci]ETV67443.1 hypothetical protein H257_16324 [Aphanomyces astaci]|eukprot:XP_009843002.1 hypothetical protein H257_16324 [Aphanomyces astaci]